MGGQETCYLSEPLRPIYTYITEALYIKNSIRISFTCFWVEQNQSLPTTTITNLLVNQNPQEITEKIEFCLSEQDCHNFINLLKHKYTSTMSFRKIFCIKKIGSITILCIRLYPCPLSNLRRLLKCKLL